MPTREVDPAKRYQQKEETFVSHEVRQGSDEDADKSKFDDGREIELLHFVYGQPNIEDLRNNPCKVLDAIDEFARTKKYLMNVGEEKGEFVTEVIGDAKPQVMVELGGYVGYSSILFGAAFRQAGGQRYWTLERNPEFAAVLTSLVDLAGLSETVKVVVGPSNTSIRRLHSAGQLQHIDVLFLDHYKPAYTADLKLCEDLKLITSGSIMAADNVISPGNPPYLEYVRSTCAQKRNAHHSAGTESSFEAKTIDQYRSKQSDDGLDHTCVGNPNLIYSSRLIESFEPTGESVRLNYLILSEDVIPCSASTNDECVNRMGSKSLDALGWKYNQGWVGIGSLNGIIDNKLAESD